MTPHVAVKFRTFRKSGAVHFLDFNIVQEKKRKKELIVVPCPGLSEFGKILQPQVSLNSELFVVTIRTIWRDFSTFHAGSL